MLLTWYKVATLFYKLPITISYLIFVIKIRISINRFIQIPDFLISNYFNEIILQESVFKIKSVGKKLYYTTLRT